MGTFLGRYASWAVIYYRRAIIRLTTADGYVPISNMNTY